MMWEHRPIAGFLTYYSSSTKFESTEAIFRLDTLTLKYRNNIDGVVFTTDSLSNCPNERINEYLKEARDIRNYYERLI